MSGRFDFSSIANSMSRMAEYTPPALSAPIIPDKRSRAEYREDFEKELSALDKDTLVNLKEKILTIHDPEELFPLKEDLENSLVKLIRFYDKFEDLNSEESRKVALKKQELKLDGRHDWSNKFRLFFFRGLGSLLLIVTLFLIGYIEHEYDWAHLPMSKYIKSVPASP